VTKDWFKDVFAERKLLLKIADVKHIAVPHYPELSVKDIFEHYKDDELLRKYLPDKFAKGRQIDRTFFFNVFNTLFPGQMTKMIDNARQQRFDSNEEEVKRETIEISDAWMSQLKSLPFKSSKFFIIFVDSLLEEAGRTIHLLKQKTKPHQGIRVRKMHAPLLPELHPSKVYSSLHYSSGT